MPQASFGLTNKSPLVSKRPAAVIAIFFILGIVLAKFLPDSIKFLHIFIITLIFMLLALFFPFTPTLSPEGRGSTANIFLFLSVTSFAALLYVNSNTFPNNHISQVLKEEKLKTGIVGIIKSPALVRKPYYGKISSTYLFEIEAIEGQGTRDKEQGKEWVEVTGLAQIRIQTEEEYRYGDRLLVKGTVRNPKFETRNPKQIQNPKSQKTHFNYAAYLENQNIFAIINASEKNVTLLSHNYKSNPILKYAYLTRDKIKNQFLVKMPPDTGAFMRAILLGDRSELPKDIQTAFKNSGTMHILAISGLNVGLVAAFFVYFFRFIGIRREISYAAIMIFLVFLMLLTGMSPSVTRAVVMCIVFLIGMLLGRVVDPYNTLAIAALFILIKNPKDIFDVGFQLSFLAVLSMIYFTPRFMRLLKGSVNIYIKKYLLSPFVVSLSASIGTFPFILYYFRMFVPISIISNIFIVPLMFVLMISGLCFSVLSWLPFIGNFLASFNHFFTSAIFFLAEFFARLEFGHLYLG